MNLFTIFHSAIRFKITKDLVKHLSLKSKRQMSCINSFAFYAYMWELTQGYFSSATVHLPRIGYNTPSFNWYGTERLVRKYLASKGIETSMYPYLILHSTAFLPVYTKTLKRWKYNSVPYMACAVWCTTSSYSKTFIFVRAQENDKLVFSNKLLSGNRFRKLAFLVPENGRLKRGKKITIFKNIRIHVNGASH